MIDYNLKSLGTMISILLLATLVVSIYCNINAQSKCLIEARILSAGVIFC